MKRVRSLPILILLFLLAPVFAHAQAPWAGVIAPNRAVDWSNAGVPGGIPSRSAICSTIAPYGSSGSPSSPSTINSAIASCASGQVVFLSAGSFYLNAPIDFAGHSNVTLRGAGANQTKLYFSGTDNCGVGFGAGICMEAAINSFPGSQYNTNYADWTAGYSAGTTSITLSNTAGLAKGMIIILDQCDDGFSGSGSGANFGGGCSTGSATDTGNVWNCFTEGVCSSPGGGAGGAGRNNRSQQQQVMVTSVSGSTVTISPGLYMPNWRTSQSPGVFWPSSMPITADSIENLSLDMATSTTVASQSTGILLDLCYGCWVTGNRILQTARNHVWLYQTSHSTVASNYMYGTQNATDESYGVEHYIGSDNLIVNNIGQHIVTSFIQGGADEGVVWAYNFAIDDYYTTAANWFIPPMYLHAAASAMDLWEGNQGAGWIGDNRHGTHNFSTVFRTYLTGTQASCYGVTCSQQTIPIQAPGANRYHNYIGNVLGLSGFQTAYSDIVSSTVCCTNAPWGNYAIFTIGWSGNYGQTTPANGANDTLAGTSMMRWGNYDVMNAAVQWNSAEVPSGFSDTTGSPSIYANAVPSSHTLPASFYYSSQPSWWATPYGTPPWPAMGPDVTGGNVPGVGGHANNIPAELCYANTPVDASYQHSYGVGAAAWSSGTVTVSAGVGSIAQGEITVSGISPSGYNGAFQITGSTPTSVSYALASNPGTYASGGSVLYPNVRLFNGCSSGTSAPPTTPQPPTGLGANVN
jgi:hypothetical protein